MTIQRKRCGKCFKPVGVLQPITVTAGGQRRESWAHEKCIPLWAETVDIKHDPLRYPITQAALVYRRNRTKIPAMATHHLSHYVINKAIRDMNHIMEGVE